MLSASRLDHPQTSALLTQHIPPKGSHLIRGHRPKVGRGWYSNKSRGMRKQAEVEASAEVSSEDHASTAAATRCSQTWAMLIKRVYEVDPLCCPGCGAQMKVVSFLEPRAPERSYRVMGRALRVATGGIVFHVLNRGNGRVVRLQAAQPLGHRRARN